MTALQTPTTERTGDALTLKGACLVGDHGGAPCEGPSAHHADHGFVCEAEATGGAGAPFARLLDGSAIGLSTLCLIHCLALPVAAALLPMLGAWAEAEWLHILFVAVAAPLSAFALLGSAHGGRAPASLMGLAAIGVGLLAFGAFAAPSEAMETPLTVAGSLCLASAHIWNWLRRT